MDNYHEIEHSETRDVVPELPNVPILTSKKRHSLATSESTVFYDALDDSRSRFSVYSIDVASEYFDSRSRFSEEEEYVAPDASIKRSSIVSSDDEGGFSDYGFPARNKSPDMVCGTAASTNMAYVEDSAVLTPRQHQEGVVIDVKEKELPDVVVQNLTVPLSTKVHSFDIAHSRFEPLKTQPGKRMSVVSSMMSGRTDIDMVDDGWTPVKVNCVSPQPIHRIRPAGHLNSVNVTEKRTSSLSPLPLISSRPVTNSLLYRVSLDGSTTSLPRTQLDNNNNRNTDSSAIRRITDTSHSSQPHVPEKRSPVSCLRDNKRNCWILLGTVGVLAAIILLCVGVYLAVKEKQ